MAINYQQEVKRLKEFVPSDGNEYWSPDAGQYKVKPIGELESAKPFENDDEQKPRAKLRISVNGQELVWGMAVGKTEASTYGQLCNLAMLRGGKLKDTPEFTVVVVGKGQDRRFTIVM